MKSDYLKLFLQWLLFIANLVLDEWLAHISSHSVSFYFFFVPTSQQNLCDLIKIINVFFVSCVFEILARKIIDYTNVSKNFLMLSFFCLRIPNINRDKAFLGHLFSDYVHEVFWQRGKLYCIF